MTVKDDLQFEIRVASDVDWIEFLNTVSRGFYADDPGERDPDAEIRMFETDRFFGFAVDGRWISTTGAHSRMMTIPGGTVGVAGITGVTVAPTYRRRGLLRGMMTRQLDDIRRLGREPVAVLWASEAPIYGRFGYGSAASEYRISGTTARTAFRLDIAPAPGRVIEVARDRFQTDGPSIHRDLLADRPGAFDRDDRWWARRLMDPAAHRGGASALRFAMHQDASGRTDGYAIYRVSSKLSDDGLVAEVSIIELDAIDAPVRAALFRWLFDLDLVRTFTATVPLDEPLFAQLADQRGVTARLGDTIYVRVVDVVGALEARRYACDDDLVIGIDDDILPSNQGSYRLRVQDGVGSVTRVDTSADLKMNIRELGSLYLSGVSPRTLHDIGLITASTGDAADRLTAILRPTRAPFCPDFF